MAARDWPLELGVTNTLVRLLRRKGIFAWHFANNTLGRNGFPDLLVCTGGRAYLFEIKSPEGAFSSLQLKVIDELAALGGMTVHWLTIPCTGSSGAIAAARILCEQILAVASVTEDSNSSQPTLIP